MNSKLNSTEQDEINKISACFNLDPTTKQLAVDFLHDFKSKVRVVIIYRSMRSIAKFSYIRNPLKN